MINDEDLKVGNYITDADGDIIRLNEIYLKKIKGTKNIPMSEGDFSEAITLDESWLLRFGFNKIPGTDHVYRYNITDASILYLNLDNGERATFFGNGNQLYTQENCKVHQLQNIFEEITSGIKTLDLSE
jgi:hypothetical protein